jgi:TIR domain-containing protein/putative peptidoglycan binding protein
MSEILVHRFERYFKHPDDGHGVLQLGDRAGACRNVRAALGLLGHPPSLLRSYGGQAVPAGGDDLFDEALSRAVHDFQQQAGHHWADGKVGPGTRGLLVRALAERSLQAFLRLPEQEAKRSVFLSYAHLDAHKVDPIDGWLRDKQVSVIRDLWEFKAGGDLAESARKAIAAADKVLAMLSAQSRERPWTKMEWDFAEQVERQVNDPVLVFVCLDDTPLPERHSERLAIPTGTAVHEVGQRILHALGAETLRPPPPPPIR